MIKIADLSDNEITQRGIDKTARAEEWRKQHGLTGKVPTTDGGRRRYRDSVNFLKTMRCSPKESAANSQRYIDYLKELQQ